ncbi:MAG: hypothetical protein ACP5HG_15915 [Anaerolineae bacterium]
MFRKTENMAWAVLIAAFLCCVTLAVGAPLLTRWFLLTSTRPLEIMLEPNGGDIRYQAPGSSAAFVVEGQSPIEIETRGRIQNENGSDAVILFYHPDQPDAPVGTIRLLGQSSLVIGKASTPRFALSKLPYHMEVTVEQAVNMRVSVSGDGRDAELRVQTPQGLVNLEEGYFRLAVESQQTDLSVRSGRATLRDPADGKTLVLVPLQGTQLTESGLGDIYVGERDILSSRNGDFREPLDAYWIRNTDKAVPEENAGTIRQIQIGDQDVVIFERVGQFWAETGIEQVINQDIREFRSLRVLARIRISTQTLPVCGTLGTECPMMIRLQFVDQETGGLREWLQGFYVMEGEYEPFCQSCEWKAAHEEVPQYDVWYNYESEDLLPLLKERGITPSAVYSVKIYASGWTYDSRIDNIAILVGE